MTEKLILPAEVKVCATCSYWDGERLVDGEFRVVVVADRCEGECLAQEKLVPGLHDVRLECACIWESLEPDEPEAAEKAVEAPVAAKVDGLALEAVGKS